MLLHPLVAVLASSELESLFHVKPGLTMPQAFRQMAGGFTGRTEEERIAAWWYLQDIAGSSARFANGVSSGSDVKMKWLNETVNMATFGDRVDLFGFMGRVQGKQQKPDDKALKHARSLDAAIAERLIAVAEPNPRMLGLHGLPVATPSMNGCRHSMMLTLLLSTLPPAERRGLTVVEVGGGYGNMARMVIEASGPDLSLDHWTIHDMPQSGLVQEYMLRMTAGQRGVNIVSSRQLPRGGLSTGKEMAAFFEAPPKTPQISLVATTVFNSWALHFAQAKVAIGTHSWSELSFENFAKYYNALAGRVEYILYATQLGWPSPHLALQKIALFKRRYNVLRNVSTEGGKVMNFVFRLRSQQLSQGV